MLCLLLLSTNSLVSLQALYLVLQLFHGCVPCQFLSIVFSISTQHEILLPIALNGLRQYLQKRVLQMMENRLAEQFEGSISTYNHIFQKKNFFFFYNGIISC